MEEECICGHLKSAHDDALNGLAKGHGPCIYSQCVCEKFTWKRFISDEELHERRIAE